jgi:uncharacterized protein (TIGR02145 family)
MKKQLKKIIVLILITSIGLLQSCKKDEVITAPITVTDIDGNTYSTITVGGVVWMAENLRTTKYNDGTAITTGLSNTDWSNTTIGAYSIYDNDPANNTTYGKLYNWYAVNTGKLAPAGWHVATEAEYTALIDNLGGSSVAGGKLKSTSSLWDAPNTGATNSSGFNGLPGGYRSMSGNYSLEGKTGYWWANTERNASQGEYTNLDNDFAATARNGATKSFGYSVRCVRN